MECNKEEAIREKETAERKFTAGDISGAKEFALRAKNLYPGLDGLSQILATLDVYIAAENRRSGEVNWYGILGVDPLADDEMIRRKYRKLALMLHPDKNKGVGANGAFKLVSEAWSVLSDRSKRLAYNHRLNLHGIQQKVSTQRGSSSTSFRANDFQKFSNRATPNSRTQNNEAQMGSTVTTSQYYDGKVQPPASMSHTSNVMQGSCKTETFWTVCHRCKMQYEYLRVYLNQTLSCPTCHQLFLASERPAPTFSTSFNQSSFSQQQGSNHHAASSKPFSSATNASVAQNPGFWRSGGCKLFNQTDSQQGLSPKTGNDGRTVASSFTASQASSVVQQVIAKAKRERDEAQAGARWARKIQVQNKLGTGLSSQTSNSIPNSALKGETFLKKAKVDGVHRGNMAHGMGRVCGLGKGTSDNAGVHCVSGCSSKLNSFSEFSQQTIRHTLMGKAQMEIRKKLEEWRSASEAKVAKRVREAREERENNKQKMMKEDETEVEIEREKNAENADARKLNNNGESSDIKGRSQADKSLLETSDDKKEVSVEPVLMNVPDPDFHNFDMDRTEHSFGENEVWAAYDDDDGMPRYYTMIHKVISLKPFKMSISWLNSKNNSEFGPLNWIGSGFAKTCGDYRVGKHEINKALNAFSHKVKWTKGSRGVIRLYPSKGEVWALYTNWSPDWNPHTPDEVIHKYDMVEVLDDYDEEYGVSVIPLAKLVGFRTVFYRRDYPKEIRRILKEEMFRFSHQVPSYLLTGEEIKTIPRGCWELDPAATPLELLQVLTDADEVCSMENTAKGKEKEVDNGE